MNDYCEASGEINYLFDVDGTLTPSRCVIDPDFKLFFLEWIKGKKVYLVTGSDYEKSREQLGTEILEAVDLCFNNAGNLHTRKGKEIYRLNWQPSPQLIAKLNQFLEESNYPLRTGNHIEYRIGMVNFSIVGRDCSYEERLEYFDYDTLNNERTEICQKIMEEFPDLEASIGGQISVDIYPKGRNKGQILSFFDGPIIFFGDMTEPGGNDYEIASKLQDPPNFVVKVRDWKDTYEYLKMMTGTKLDMQVAYQKIY
jgi:phosphomannomutase